MATQLEAMKMALDALDISQSLQEQWKSNHHAKTLAAYYALKSVIEAAENVKPIGYITDSGNSAWIEKGLDIDDDTPIYINTLSVDV